MSKTVVVFTATGEQGKSVVDAMLGAGWNVIGLTRDPSSEKSKAIEKKGVKLHKADLANPDSYKDALKGADAVFVNTDFWALYGATKDGEKAKQQETEQAIAAFKACKEAGVKHVIQSTLDGHANIAHWDSKYEATKYAPSEGIPFTPLYLTMYVDAVARQIKPKDKEGEFNLGWPIPDDVKVPVLAVEQTGLWVKEAFENPDKWIGKDIYATSDIISGGEMAKALSELSGKKVETNHITNEAFNSDQMKKNMGDELWQNMRAFNNEEIKRDLKSDKAGITGAWDFKGWASNNAQLKKTLGY